VWRTGFERVYGPVVRQNTEWWCSLSSELVYVALSSIPIRSYFLVWAIVCCSAKRQDSEFEFPDSKHCIHCLCVDTPERCRYTREMYQPTTFTHLTDRLVLGEGW
jgi:hypothetical protein